MDYILLGYSEKWVTYGLLDEETFNRQLEEFEKAEDKSTEQYRYNTFMQWLQSKEAITNKEIENFIELAIEDSNLRMGGAAVKELFISSILSIEQFDLIKSRLPEFGDWTKKLISREVLIRRLKNEELTEELFNDCFEHKKEHKDNVLIETIINETENIEFLTRLTTKESGKQIRTLASKKIKRIERKDNM